VFLHTTPRSVTIKLDMAITSLLQDIGARVDVRNTD
jgi:hypothetical protein